MTWYKTWYKSAQNGSLECEMSPDELLLYQTIIHLSYIFKDSNIDKSDPTAIDEALKRLGPNHRYFLLLDSWKDFLKNHPSLVEIMRSGYAPLAFSRCIRTRKSDVLKDHWSINLQAIQHLFLNDQPYSDPSIIKETRTNLAHWFMETFMPIITKDVYIREYLTNNTLRMVVQVVIPSEYVTSDMIIKFWESCWEERNKYRKMETKQNRIPQEEIKPFLQRKVIFESLLKNRNTPNNIQLEITKLTGFSPESFRWLVTNPNGSGDAMKFILKDSNDAEQGYRHLQSYSLASLADATLHNIYKSMPIGAKINDSIAIAISNHVLKMFIPLQRKVEDTTLDEPTAHNKTYIDLDDIIAEQIELICMKSDSKEALNNILSSIISYLGIEKTEHSLVINGTYNKIRGGYSHYNNDLPLRFFSLLVANHKKIDQEWLQRILIYIVMVRRYLLAPPSEENLNLPFSQTLEAIWYHISQTLLKFVDPKEHREKWNEYAVSIKNDIINAVEKLDKKKLLARAESAGVPKLGMYKLALDHIKLKMNKKKIHNNSGIERFVHKLNILQ
jgi:hypothetical protein